MDFKALLSKALPFIGAAATGNVPALIAMAAKEVSSVLGVDVPAEPDAIASAVANASPEQLVALRTRELEFKERMQAMGFQHEKDLANIALDETKAYVQDTADARSAHKSDRGVYWLGIAVLVTFAAIMGFSLYGSYKILTGGMHVIDTGVAAAVFTFLGTVVGYVAANAQQVVSYFFGSSRGSKEKTDRMAEAVRRLGVK